MAMMVVSKYHIKDVYKTEELESELRQALNNNDKHLSALVQEQLEGIKKWLDEEINRVNQKYENMRAVARNAALTAKMKGMKAEIVKLQQRIGTVSKILTKVVTDVETGKIFENILFFKS
jgi:hypothetical protein